jgi:chromosome segregation ATPase
MAATQTQSDERDDGTTAADRGDRDGAPGGDAGRGRDHDDPGDDPAALKAVLERTRKALADANRKAETERKQFKAARERLDDLDRAAEERRKEELPEVERVRADLKARDAEIRARDERIGALEREADDLRVDILIIQEATGKFRNPKAALRLVDRDRIDHDPDTREVRLATVKDAVKRVLDEFPELNGAAAGGGSPAARIPGRPVAGAGRTAPEPTLRERVARTGGYEAM